MDQLKKRRKRDDKPRRSERSSKRKPLLDTASPLKKLFASLLKQTVQSRVEKAVASGKDHEADKAQVIKTDDVRKSVSVNPLLNSAAEPKQESLSHSTAAVDRPIENSVITKRKVLLEAPDDPIISLSLPEKVGKKGSSKSTDDPVPATKLNTNLKVDTGAEQKKKSFLERIMTVKTVDNSKRAKTKESPSSKVNVDPKFLISFLGECSKKQAPQKHKRRFILDEEDDKRIKEEREAMLRNNQLIGAQDKTAAVLESVLERGSTVALESVLEPLFMKYSARIFGRGYGGYQGWRSGYRGYSGRAYGSRGYRSRGYRGRGYRSRGRGRGYRGRGRSFKNLSWSADDSTNKVIPSEGDVPVPCFYDPYCNRVDCHFQHPKRNTQTKEFLGKTG